MLRAGKRSSRVSPSTRYALSCDARHVPGPFCVLEHRQAAQNFNKIYCAGVVTRGSSNETNKGSIRTSWAGGSQTTHRTLEDEMLLSPPQSMGVVYMWKQGPPKTCACTAATPAIGPAGAPKIVPKPAYPPGPATAANRPAAGYASITFFIVCNQQKENHPTPGGAKMSSQSTLPPCSIPKHPAASTRYAVP